MSDYPRAAKTEDNGLLFWCVGCDEAHAVKFPPWTWNESLELPTIRASVLVRGNQWPKDEYPDYYRPNHAKVQPGEDTICHSFVTDGNIEYLSDSTHHLAGQTVPLLKWPPHGDKGPEGSDDAST